MPLCETDNQTQTHRYTHPYLPMEFLSVCKGPTQIPLCPPAQSPPRQDGAPLPWVPTTCLRLSGANYNPVGDTDTHTHVIALYPLLILAQKTVNLSDIYLCYDQFKAKNIQDTIQVEQ